MNKISALLGKTVEITLKAAMIPSMVDVSEGMRAVLTHIVEYNETVEIILYLEEIGVRILRLHQNDCSLEKIRDYLVLCNPEEDIFEQWWATTYKGKFSSMMEIAFKEVALKAWKARGKI